MSKRSLFTGLVAFLLAVLGAGGTSTAALPRPSISGTVIFFDPDTLILSVNTRLGFKSFRITQDTILLLNNHQATVEDILPGDDVTVTYILPSAEATLVHLFRETRRDGRVTTVSGGTVNFRVRSNNARLNLTTNAASVLRLAGIPIQNVAIFADRPATVIFETDTFVILSLSAQAPSVEGAITAIDAATRTVSVQTRQGTLNFTVDTAATVRREGVFSTLGNLLVGDRVRVAYARRQSVLRALAINAQGAPTAVAAPTNLTLAAVSQNQIQLSWTDNSPDESGFRIERRASDQTTFREIQVVPAAAGTGTTVTANDGSVAPDRTYEYRVRAYRTTGSTMQLSLYSNVAGPIQPSNPPVPARAGAPRAQTGLRKK